MHIAGELPSGEEAGQANPVRPSVPLRLTERGVRVDFQLLRRHIRDFDDWMTRHREKLASSHRLELEQRLQGMDELWESYVRTLLDLADSSYFDATKDFRDRYFITIARAKKALEAKS